MVTVTLSAKQYTELMRPPDSRAVHQRQQAGKTFTYLAQHAVRTELIRVFGFDGWNGEVIEADLIHLGQDDRERWVACWKVRYRLTVRFKPAEGALAGSVSTWVEAAVGSAVGPSQGDALDQALKSASSDAMKRCAMNLGSRFGIGLYFDGYQGEVVRTTIDDKDEPTQDGESEVERVQRKIRDLSSTAAAPEPTDPEE